MAYSAATTTTTEFSGTMKTVVLTITPDAATGSVTVTGISTFVGAVASFNADATTNCYVVQAAVDGSTKNKINFKLWKAGGTAADTAYVGFTVIAVGY